MWYLCLNVDIMNHIIYKYNSQSDLDHASTNVNYPAESIEMPANLDKNNGTNFTNDETRELKSPSSTHRPDSGVGESVIIFI